MHMILAEAQPLAVHYVPIATTVISAVFCGVLVARYIRKGWRGPHLLWWAVGVFFYGLGTALESTITLAGNSIALNKAWYIAGAILGGYPLAQGTVYLLLKRRTAHVLSACSLPLVVIASVLVIASPAIPENLEPHRPSGAVLAWRWVRLLTPLINGYAALFLIGGAVLSAWRFARKAATGHRAIGNALIALGALLPGIGGGMAKGGIVEGLYVGEFLGILLIWAGYAFCVRRPSAKEPDAPTAVVTAER
ncbi:MAG: hypothetical protein D6744_05470 [Planctomycetota bacterium]|nr:MAG: hypothetical protein D6744_05470 [Planctomycetota bacterium]